MVSCNAVLGEMLESIVIVKYMTVQAMTMLQQVTRKRTTESVPYTCILKGHSKILHDNNYTYTFPIASLLFFVLLVWIILLPDLHIPTIMVGMPYKVETTYFTYHLSSNTWF
jgi:hypothetical protein